MARLLSTLPAILRHGLSDRRGVTAMEYGIIAAVTVVVIGAAAIAIQGNLSTIWGDISTSLSNSASGA